MEKRESKEQKIKTPKWIKAMQDTPPVVIFKGTGWGRDHNKK